MAPCVGLPPRLEFCYGCSDPWREELLAFLLLIVLLAFSAINSSFLTAERKCAKFELTNEIFDVLHRIVVDSRLLLQLLNTKNGGCFHHSRPLGLAEVFQKVADATAADELVFKVLE